MNQMTLVVTFIIDLRDRIASFSVSLSMKSVFYSNDHLHGLIESSNILLIFRADDSHSFGIAIQSISTNTYTEGIDRFSLTRRGLDE
jgi:hypothetical protein